jgi:hypothetical protein
MWGFNTFLFCMTFGFGLGLDLILTGLNGTYGYAIFG